METRSISSSRSTSSAWALRDTYSPDAIEIAPANSPVMPANRTREGSVLAPAKPRINATFETRPSLTPNTAARADPPCTSRWRWTIDDDMGRNLLRLA